MTETDCENFFINDNGKSHNCKWSTNASLGVIDDGVVDPDDHWDPAGGFCEADYGYRLPAAGGGGAIYSSTPTDHVKPDPVNGCGSSNFWGSSTTNTSWEVQVMKKGEKLIGGITLTKPARVIFKRSTGTPGSTAHYGTQPLYYQDIDEAM
jgi:hypothetical protein